MSEDDLLQGRLEEAARHLEADPALPGWVLWYVTDLTSRPERRAKQRQEAQVAAKYGLHVQTQRVRVGVGSGQEGWGYFTFASRAPELTPEQVAHILSVYLAPHGRDSSGGDGSDSDDGRRYTVINEAADAAREREVADARAAGRARWARRVLAAALGLGAIAAAVGVSTIWWLPAHENRDHRLPFESAAWKADSRSAGPTWPTRLRMADHLLSGGVLRGKTRAEVTALLGPPDSSGTAEMGYYLGPERGWIRIDSEVLSVRFGSDGRVTDCYIWRD